MNSLSWSRMNIRTKITIAVFGFVILGYVPLLYLNFVETSKAQSKIDALYEDRMKQSQLLMQEQKNLAETNLKNLAIHTKELVHGSINQMMLSGNAGIVRDWLESMRENEIFSDLQILRTYPQSSIGRYAFRDNDTTDIVNRNLGSKTFSSNHEQQPLSIDPEGMEKLKEVMTNNKEMFYDKTMPDGTKVLVGLFPIPNSPECQSCHGDDHTIRDVIKIAISKERVVTIDKTLSERMAKEKAKVGEMVDTLDSNVWMSRIKMLIAALVGSGIMINIILAFLRRFVINPLNNILKIAETIAGGDLTSDIRVSYNDEIGQLYASLANMQKNLAEILHMIESHSNQVKDVSEKVSGLSRNIANGSEQQTAKTDQVATAVEQMSATVGEIASNSSQAVSSSEEARVAAVEGEGVARDAVSAMHEISESVVDSGKSISALGKSTEQINEIIAVIDGIANQTNLLALNASIEAARAGEAGRGFAVVADEVRKLAERTSKATKEIGEMISTIQSETATAVSTTDKGITEVRVGVKLVERAGESLGKISSLIESVSSTIGNIAVAAEEQASAVQEVAASAHKVASVCRNTSTNTHESVKAADHLSSLATELHNLIERFKI